MDWDYGDFDDEGPEEAPDEGPDAQIIAGPWSSTPIAQPLALVAAPTSPALVVDAAPSDEIPTPAATAPEPVAAAVPTYAMWHQRALAVGIDSAGFLPALVALAFSPTVAIILFVLALAFNAWQVSALQGRTGRTLGKRCVGISLVRASDLSPMGWRAAALRQLAHAVDIALFGVGYLWPLWDAQHQTFADQLFATIVVSD